MLLLLLWLLKKARWVGQDAVYIQWTDAQHRALQLVSLIITLLLPVLLLNLKVKPRGQAR
jgi:hypothetical protein